VVAVQNYYNLLRRDDDAEVLPLCRELGIGYIPYFPLESGLLTGKYRRGAPHPAGTRIPASDGRLAGERLEQVEALEGYGADRGRTLLEVAIGGLASIPGVASVIAGATSAAQVRANAAAGAWHAGEADLGALEHAAA
jgi:aryl-alcohol dehydrogenase-like predicted oxidoreductase